MVIYYIGCFVDFRKIELDFVYIMWKGGYNIFIKEVSKL